LKLNPFCQQQQEFKNQNSNVGYRYLVDTERDFTFKAALSAGGITDSNNP
jgi:hypothetical protein